MQIVDIAMRTTGNRLTSAKAALGMQRAPTARAWTDDKVSRTLRAWLLAILRYAITLDNADRLAVLAASKELDQCASSPDLDFKFFCRTSANLCSAIRDPQAPTSPAILQNHLARIEEQKLRAAFAAAVGLMPVDSSRRRKRRLQSDLWKGLTKVAERQESSSEA